MTLDEYKKIRDAAREKFLEVAKLLDKAGVSGAPVLYHYRESVYAEAAALRKLSFEDFMALLDEERREREGQDNAARG